MKKPYIHYYGAFYDGAQLMKVYAVDGPFVRRTYPGGLDFFVGHHEAFHWIPDDEVWIDSVFPVEEVEFMVGSHELPEHWKMKVKHMLYWKAHNEVNKIELRDRRAFRPAIHISRGGKSCQQQ